MDIKEFKKILIKNYHIRKQKNCIGSVEKVVEELFDGVDESFPVELPVKPASSGLLQYIPDEPMELPDNGAIQNKYGITASGVKILNELREILIKAGY